MVKKRYPLIFILLLCSLAIVFIVKAQSPSFNDLDFESQGVCGGGGQLICGDWYRRGPNISKAGTGSTYARSGTYGLHLINAAYTGTLGVCQDFTLSTGGTLVMGFWAKRVGTNPENLGEHIYTSDTYQHISGRYHSTIGASWDYRERTFTIPNSGNYALCLSATNLAVDDISIVSWTPAPTQTPTNTPTPTPTSTPTNTPTPTPTSTPVNACAITWDFDSGLGEWNTGLGNYYQGPGNPGYGLAFQDIGVGNTTYLQQDEILTNLGYPATSFINSDGLTFDIYSRQIGSSQAWLIFDYMSGANDTIAFGNPATSPTSATWQRSTINNTTTGDVLKTISIVSHAGTSFYDNIVLDIPCANIIDYSGTPQPTNPPTYTPTPTNTPPPGSTSTPTPSPPPPGSTNTPYPTATTGPTSTPPPWANPTATLPPPTQAPAPSPTPIGNPGGDPLPIPAGDGLTCYELTPPAGYGITYFGQWIVYLGGLINNLFSCSLKYWLYDITNSVGGLLTLLWNFSTWLWQTFSTLFDLMVNMLSVWLQFGLNMMTDYASWIAHLIASGISYWVTFFVQLFQNGLDWVQSGLDFIGDWFASLFAGLSPTQFVYQLMQSALGQAVQMAIAFVTAARDVFLTLAAAFIQLVITLMNAVISFVEMLRNLFIAVRDAFSAAPYTINVDGTSAIDTSDLDATGVNNSKILWIILMAATLVDTFVSTFQPYMGAVLAVIVGALAIGVILWTMHVWRDVLPV